MPRDAVLAAVRAALADVAGVAPDAMADAPPASTSASPADGAALLADFAREARAVGTVVHVVPTSADAGPVLAAILADVRTTRVVAWRSPLAHAVTLAAAGDGIDVRFAGPETDAAAIAAADAGITEADALVAASGTLVLRAASGARTVSLLPALHVAVVPAARIVSDLGAALRASRGPGGAPDTCVTLVTGPSRTADIEKKLVVGVHGPCALHVIVIEDGEA
jgi:L-lactate dehydrogenase complex protein LldG